MGFEVRPSWLQTTASPLSNATTLGELPNPSLGLHVLTFEKVNTSNHTCPITWLSSLNEITCKEPQVWCLASISDHPSPFLLLFPDKLGPPQAGPLL